MNTTSSSIPALLEARGVGKKFGAVVAAADLNIRIAAGERVSLIGSNGAGKTTFVNMITGYLKPDEGQILLDAQAITRLHPRAISHLGVARSFQIPQLFGDLSVIDNMLVANACHDGHLSFWRSARRAQAVARADALLARFALIRSPKLLLLDEPTSGVSAEEKFPMMETIMAGLDQDQRESQGAATTVLFVEHDMDIVKRYASRVIAFYSGRVIADARPDEALATDDVRRYVTGELLSE
jgi:branched-chain amino acid transport system ATP-binding protein